MSELGRLYEIRESFEGSIQRNKKQLTSCVKNSVFSAIVAAGSFTLAYLISNSDGDSSYAKNLVSAISFIGGFSGLIGLSLNAYDSIYHGVFLRRNRSELRGIEYKIEYAREDLLEAVRTGEDFPARAAALDDEVEAGRVDSNEAKGVEEEGRRNWETIREQNYIREVGPTEWDPDEDDGYDPRFRDSLGI